ncbi:MAG: hypothetical protein A2651_00670 [Candidatus Yanofskybacteria bacterium RIFCSPHIGHO2_01_FULL_42_12]|uniref:Uncharacterized protein n=1 Tax=Candidatus Yanofskybacteria bacterium RIFCSPLOWO2_01_FULL_42_49 TaxID=1802694 RepID=A0A1F8GA49_9BACT|nr:MAG: hypothetical protein A2651_00670 [Candidatus Yanofskybacteria bacterium RIFCSPHIGHO2_01_FULL_42_12]OGN22244.1 MAG: hypothetical protein A2918_02555 [Candidatus Yanofskybacteria bacterium RIFCSPLOWO2_01_FULL_42_49]
MELPDDDDAENNWALKLLGIKIQLLGNREKDENRQLVYIVMLASLDAVNVVDSVEKLTEDFNNKVGDVFDDPFQKSKDKESDRPNDNSSGLNPLTA